MGALEVRADASCARGASSVLCIGIHVGMQYNSSAALIKRHLCMSCSNGRLRCRPLP